jgi:hypothetical protein
MMKAKKYFFVLLFITTFQAYGQLTAGLRAGGSYTNILAPDQKYYKFIPGFHAGIYMEYDFEENLSFQTEVVYAKKGSQYKYTEPPYISTPTIITTYNVKYNLSYIDVPLLLNIHFGQAGAYVGLGPQVSFLIHSQADGDITTVKIYNGTIPTTNQTSTYDNTKDKWNKIDFGAVFGLGSKWQSGLEYCLRAGYGFTSPVVEFYRSVSGSDAKFHNLAFTVTVGYAFGEKSGSYVTDKRYKGKRRRH